MLLTIIRLRHIIFQNNTEATIATCDITENFESIKGLRAENGANKNRCRFFDNSNQHGERTDQYQAKRLDVNCLR